MQVFEGVGIALDSIKANKGRASLTILGVAIGVAVVMVIAAMITGINRGVTDLVEQLGPRTFFVVRYFQGGINISDGSDRRELRRRTRRLTLDEAEILRELESVEFLVVRSDWRASIDFKNVNLESVTIAE